MNFEILKEEDLAKNLRRFYAEVRTKKGDTYSKSAYGNLRAGIQRHISSPPYNRVFNIMTGDVFKPANFIYQGQLKQMKINGLDKSQHKTPMSENDLQLLKEHLKSQKHTPKGLQNKVTFDILFHFGRRGREGLRNMKRDSFEFVKDGEGREYARLAYNEHDKNHGETDNKAEETDKRMYAQPMEDECPVASLKEYIGHLNLNEESFFQRANQHFQPGVFGRWYDSAPVGRSSLGNFMPRISKEAGLAKRYTNHCVRASTITTLKHAGVGSSDIISVTGHKREESLSHYCKEPSDKRKYEMSNVLFQKGKSSGPIASTSTVSVVPNSPIRQIGPIASTSTSVVPSSPELSASQATSCSTDSISEVPREVKSMFAGAIFKGPVNFNININKK